MDLFDTSAVNPSKCKFHTRSASAPTADYDASIHISRNAEMKAELWRFLWKLSSFTIMIIWFLSIQLWLRYGGWLIHIYSCFRNAHFSGLWKTNRIQFGAFRSVVQIPDGLINNNNNNHNLCPVSPQKRVQYYI